MRKKEVAAKLNKASILFFLLSSLIILMIPFADSETNPALSIASGVIFWAGLILGIVCYAVVAVLQLVKISKIPKTDALKNVE